MRAPSFRAFLLLSILSHLVSAASPNDWHDQLARPEPAFTQMPFWFWNDDLTDEEIKRQLTDFREHGVYGFVIHPRMGLPKSIPYLGERWLHFVKLAVEEAARTGMRVCLYDEAMYPSGSAHGEVVRSNPAFAAQGLMMIEQEVTGPKEIESTPNQEGTPVATVLARRIDKKLDFLSFQLVASTSRTLAVPAGSWSVMRFVQIPSGGCIRGVHPGEDDHEPDAPRAADLLNPEAVQAFLRFGYEPYAAALKPHFGRTIIGFFTDEPSMLGRGGRRGLIPWTSGFADYFQKHRGYDLLPLLPALFERRDGEAQRVRGDFEAALDERLDEVYYAQLSDWCAAHGIALTGHPAASDDIVPLRRFQIPGQDMVWRWLLPGNASGLEGVNSTVAKCASSVARHDAREQNSMEIYGAYGWHLTMDEMKWLADWMFVRGVNLLYPHAFYYSIRDERVHERPPDLGPNNMWWPHYRLFADYTARLSGLLTGSEQVCDVAILSVNNHLPWSAAKWLFQHQIDFNYLEDWRLLGRARFEKGRMAVGPMKYSTLVLDNGQSLSPPLAARVNAFKEAGGRVIEWETTTSSPPGWETRDVTATPEAPDLRCIHLRKAGVDFLLLTNEGEAAIETRLTCRFVGRAEWFDAWTGQFTPASVTKSGPDRMTVLTHLGRRESRVLCVDTHQKPPASSSPPTRITPPQIVPLSGPWSVVNNAGQQVGEALGDWRKLPATQTFAGKLIYRTTFTGPVASSALCSLDIGQVGDWAVLRINGKNLGSRLWAPFEWDVTKVLREGKNEVEIEVTNSLANRYAPKDARPSGLLGPVMLKVNQENK